MQTPQPQEHGQRCDERADEARRPRHFPDQQHPDQRPRDRIEGREQVPAGPIRRVRPRFASEQQPHDSSDSERVGGFSLPTR